MDRSLGRIPLGVDISEGMLRYAADRLPVAPARSRSRAVTPPFADGSLPAVVAVTVHRHAHLPGRTARGRPRPGARPGYRDAGWTTASWTDQGLRDKVGATHLPLPGLLHAVLDAGLTFERFAEASPMVLAWRAGN